MKNTIAFAVIVAMTSLGVVNMSAQSMPQVQLQTIQYSQPPVSVQGYCNVNGVVYPVDFNSAIWGRNAYNQWSIIGRIQATPAGYIAVRLDGMTFPASCQ